MFEFLRKAAVIFLVLGVAACGGGGGGGVGDGLPNGDPGGIADTDGDGVANAVDNCPTVPNPAQTDANQNQVGDACEPAATADAVTWVGNTPLTLTAADLLGNDLNVGTSLIAVSPTGTTNGTVALNADGTVTYTPSDLSRVADSFSYTVASNVVPAVTATGTVTVSMPTLAWYVNNAGPSGNGTLAQPFNALLTAELASAAGDTIFVFTGNGSLNQSQGIILKDNQRLIGQGVDFTLPLTVNAATRSLAVPGGAAAEPPVPPAIANDGTRAALPPGASPEAAGVGVFLANGNEVAGLSISQTTDEGIMGINTTGFSIHHNVIANTVRDGIQLMDPAGVPPVVNEIRANRLTATGTDPIRRDHGIRIDNGVLDVPPAEQTTPGTAVTLLIDGNVISGAGSDGIRMDATGAQSFVTATITGNEVSNSGGVGILGAASSPVGAVAPSTGFDLRIRGNTVTGNAGHGITLGAEGEAKLSADISQNTSISNNGGRGIVLTGTGAATVQDVLVDGNVAINGNVGAGIAVNLDGTVRSRMGVRGNRFSGNNAGGGAGAFQVVVATGGLAPGPELCMQFLNNVAVGPGFQLLRAAGVFNLEEGATTSNNPAPTLVGVNLVGPGTCALPPPPAP